MQRPLQLEGGETPGPLFAPGFQKKPTKGQSRGRRRIALLKQRTPPWADRAAIRRFYVLARQATELTGVLHTVDHIIPLNNPRVSGLHVETNLQVAMHEDNMRKGNNWAPEQQELFDAGLHLPLQPL